MALCCIGGVCIPYTALVPLMVYALKWCLQQLAACGVLPDTWHQYFVQGLLGRNNNNSNSNSSNKKKTTDACCSHPETTTTTTTTADNNEDDDDDDDDGDDVVVVSTIRSEPQWNALLDAHHTVVCKFGAEWCKPCHAIQPFFEALAERQATHQKCKPAMFCTMDVDHLNDVASERYGIALLPTFVVFRNGNEIGRYAGGNEIKVRDFLDQHLA